MDKGHNSLRSKHAKIRQAVLKGLKGTCQKLARYTSKS
jgi:hypothetical protein